MEQRPERCYGSPEGLIMNGPNFPGFSFQKSQIPGAARVTAVEWIARHIQRKSFIGFD
jgi:hypothetical protein